MGYEWPWAFNVSYSTRIFIAVPKYITNHKNDNTKVGNSVTFPFKTKASCFGEHIWIWVNVLPRVFNIS